MKKTIEACLLSNNIMDYRVVAQGKTTIPNVDDGEEFELTDVRHRLSCDPFSKFFLCVVFFLFHFSFVFEPVNFLLRRCLFVWSLNKTWRHERPIHIKLILLTPFMAYNIRHLCQLIFFVFQLMQIIFFLILSQMEWFFVFIYFFFLYLNNQLYLLLMKTVIKNDNNNDLCNGFLCSCYVFRNANAV